MVSQRGLYRSLKCMIDWTKQWQDKLQDADGLCPKAQLSPKQWAKEFCTIKFCLPRQSGHTTFAKKLIEEIGRGALYVAPNPYILRFANVPPQHRATPDSIARGNHKGMRIHTVIVDCASLMSQKDIDGIYDAFSHQAVAEHHFLFVFLQ